ncbi:MAG: tRNA lysidine(34) synthetase TilS [Gallintestinimicrobium sp.]
MWCQCDTCSGTSRQQVKNTASGEKYCGRRGKRRCCWCFFKKYPSKKYTKWLDYDKIIQSVVFRTRRSGDYLTIDDNFSKKLKEIYDRRKIPANERNSMMVLADGNHIIWVPGGRISTYYRVTEQTRVILKLPVWRSKNRTENQGGFGHGRKS